MASTVRVQPEDFDLGAEIAAMRAGKPQVGAVVAFLGTVRELDEGAQISALTLEHYPGMTEAALIEICRTAETRWNLVDALVVHRCGALRPEDQIVLVAVSAPHRGDAFAACELIIDYLKTRAPFWKKETTADGTRWIEAREDDATSAARWSMQTRVERLREEELDSEAAADSATDSQSAEDGR